jgi:hypothetical protein
LCRYLVVAYFRTAAELLNAVELRNATDAVLENWKRYGSIPSCVALEKEAPTELKVAVVKRANNPPIMKVGMLKANVLHIHIGICMFGSKLACHVLLCVSMSSACIHALQKSHPENRNVSEIGKEIFLAPLLQCSKLAEFSLQIRQAFDTVREHARLTQSIDLLLFQQVYVPPADSSTLLAEDILSPRTAEPVKSPFTGSESARSPEQEVYHEPKPAEGDQVLHCASFVQHYVYGIHGGLLNASSNLIKRY